MDKRVEEFQDLFREKASFENKKAVSQQRVMEYYLRKHPKEAALLAAQKEQLGRSTEGSSDADTDYDENAANENAGAQLGPEAFGFKRSGGMKPGSAVVVEPEYSETGALISEKGGQDGDSVSEDSRRRLQGWDSANEVDTSGEFDFTTSGNDWVLFNYR
jgi:hypothetical protein